MNKRKNRQIARVNTKSAELALATPQVMAHRLWRMAQADTLPSARDQKEFQTMFIEKQTAFSEAWFAMGLQLLKANQSIAMAAMFNFGNPLLFSKSCAALTKSMQGSALDILEKGLVPVHRTATANSKRLGKVRL